MKYGLATLAATLLVSSVAMADPEAPPTAVGLVSPLSAGGTCTSFTVGNVRFAFDANMSNNQAGRFAAINNASNGGYPVKVWIASQVGFTSNFDGVSCSPAGPSQGGQSGILTPWFVEPAN